MAADGSRTTATASAGKLRAASIPTSGDVVATASALRRVRTHILAAWDALCDLEVLHAGCTLRCDYREYMRVQLRIQAQRYDDLRNGQQVRKFFTNEVRTLRARHSDIRSAPHGR